MEHFGRLRVALLSKLTVWHKIRDNLSSVWSSNNKMAKEKSEEKGYKDEKSIYCRRTVHSTRDTDRLYSSRMKCDRNLTSCQECIEVDENSLGWYIKNVVFKKYKKGRRHQIEICLVKILKS